jgi:hypothetical protein
MENARYLSSLKSPKLASFEWQEPEDDKDRSSFRDILTAGCTILMIHDDESAPAPPFGLIYTVGLYLNLGHPEFFIKGALDDSQANLMNSLFQYVEAGNKISDGDSVRHDFGNGEVRFVAKAFPQNRYFDYLGWGCWFYRSLLFKVSPVCEHKFPVLQLFWPDAVGKYPFEEGCDERVVKMQALDAVS